MSLSESEIRAIARDELRQLLSPLLGNPENYDQWLPASAIYQRLGYANEKELYADVRSKLLRIGKEVMDKRRPGSKKPRYRFNVAACEKRLLESPGKRSIRMV